MARGRATASNAKKKSKPPSRAKGTHRRHRVRAHDTGHDEPVERTSGHEAAGDAAGSGQGGFSWEAFLTSDDPPPGPGDTGSSVAELEAFLMHTEWREGRPARERAREEAWAERERQRLADPEAFMRAQEAAEKKERRADMKENAPEKHGQFRKKERERYHRGQSEARDYAAYKVEQALLERRRQIDEAVQQAKDQEMRERRNREVPPTEQASREKRRKLAESMGAKVYYLNDGKGGGQGASSGHRVGARRVGRRY
eukprot:jgi/Mesvir1/1638/Mv02876-RA.1